MDVCVWLNGTEDEEMLHHLWNGLFPMLPYEGRVNPRWRDIGFQVQAGLVVCILFMRVCKLSTSCIDSFCTVE